MTDKPGNSIHIVFFASVREAAGTEWMDVEATGISTVSELIQKLRGQGSVLKEALSAENLLVAVNQSLVESSHGVESGDEVAFFPPVTGG